MTCRERGGGCSSSKTKPEPLDHDADPEQLAERLSRILEGIPKVTFAYLFGGRAKGKRSGDVDVAIWLDGEVDYLWLIARLGEAIHAEIDLVLLNGASPLMRQQVLLHGRLLLCRDKNALVRFKVCTLHEYEDFRHLQEVYVRRRYGRQGSVPAGLNRLQAYVDDLKEVQGVTWQEYSDDVKIRRFVERTLQLALEEMIDIGQHISLILSGSEDWFSTFSI